MNANVRRQIKDIQVRAEHLLNGRPTLEDLEDFDQYNEELKKYLISNLNDTDLVERVRSIPKVLDETGAQVATTGFLSAVLAVFGSWLTSYFQERRQIENSMDAVREVRSAYGSIEFFTKHLG